MESHPDNGTTDAIGPFGARNDATNLLNRRGQPPSPQWGEIPHSQARPLQSRGHVLGFAADMCVFAGFSGLSWAFQLL
jgi:hypothetical protein